MKIYNLKSTNQKRKLLRRSQTEAEKKLWENLRNARFQGHKFFRQYGIGHYIADFYCPKSKLVIEVDGINHSSKDGIEYDKEREKYLSALNIKTLRLLNQEVLENSDQTLRKIEKAFLT